MSYEDALADLKEQFGSKKLLDTDEVAAAIGRSRDALAMMRLRKQFPACKKIGRRVVVSIYDLARFIAGEYSAPTATPAAKPTPPSANTPAPSRSRRPPSLAKALTAFRQSIGQQELQVEFQNGVFAGLEAIDIAASISAKI